MIFLQSQLAQKKNSPYLANMHNDQLLAPSISLSVLEHLSQGVVLLDVQNKIIFINSFAEALIGKNSCLPEIFLRKELDSYFVHFQSKALEIKKIQSKEGLFLLIQDRTALREVNRNNRLKEIGGMTSLLAHEIRNPLGGIKGFAALLHRDLKERPELQQMAGFILDGTEHLNRLLTHILNFANPFQTQIGLHDLVVLIKDLQNHILADQNLNKHLHFKFNTLYDSFLVRVDYQLLRSALLNLIINGIQAMPDGGTLTITLDKYKDYATIQVSDTGIGIPEENMNKIFSKFFTTKSNGNGFGLLEVNQVVQAHAGKIEIETIVGKGSSFTINLPVNHAL